MCASGRKPHQESSSTSSAHVEPVEELVDGRDPQQPRGERHDLGAGRIVRAGEQRQYPGPRQRQQQAGTTHVQRGEGDDPVAEPEGPAAITRPDRLPDQRRTGERDTVAGHVGDRGEHHHDLRGRAVDGAEAHLHDLEQREAEQIGRRQQAHREAESQLRGDAPRARPPGQVRAVVRTVVAPQEDPHREHQPQRLRHRGRVGGPGDAQAKMEDEVLVQQGVAERHDRHDRERHAWPSDAVEEPHGGPGGRAERGAGDARQPELHGQVLDVARQAEQRQQRRAGQARGEEQRRHQQYAPERDPHRARGMRAPPRAEGLGRQRLHRLPDPAEHDHDHQREPVHRAHGRQRVGGKAADEPHVGQAQDQLHGAVGHHRQRQRQDRAHVDVLATRGVDAPCRQLRRRGHCRNAVRKAATGGATKLRRRRYTWKCRG
jgi:hypothetical protein